MPTQRTFTAFDGTELVAKGDLTSMLRATKTYLDARLNAHPHTQLLIFDDSTGRQVDYDFRGTVEEVLERYVPEESAKGPGRPKLGVVSREVTLLPRHWEWLAEQPSGASATLRRLVDEARKSEDEAVRSRRVTGRVMTALAGDRPNFEEAYRALDAGDRHRFEALIGDWPEDVRGHLLDLAEAALG